MSFLNSFLPSQSRSYATDNREGNTATTAAVRPTYNVKETDEGYQLTAYLPGVNKQDLSITDEEGVLTIKGERSWKQPSEWTSLYRESRDPGYSLALQHDNVIDADKITAELVDGVLRLTLPKTEASKPRKIAVS